MKNLNFGSLKYELMSRCESMGQISFLMKGADTVIGIILQYSDWLVEKMDHMFRVGRRPLVVASKMLSHEQHFI